MKWFFAVLFSLGLVVALSAQSLEVKPADSYFEKFKPLRAPVPARLLLKQGDRLAICGDSITEQKMYSRAIETYLTVCVPELEISVRQYGWGGETAPGFLARMTNDCLRFKPTVATTCYGMNDHGYQPYQESIGKRYRDNQTAIVEAFLAAKTRVVLGSPGCVGLRQDWDAASVEAKNLNLCTLRNIDIEIAQKTGASFADVFWPMLTAGYVAQQKYGTNFAIAGQDGVHPGWAGSFVMAHAFLKAFGLQGELGTFTVDLETGTVQVTSGHQLLSTPAQLLKSGAGSFEVRSRRYPFCAAGDVAKDDNIRAAMALVPFNEELNRLTLVVTKPRAARYRVSWGKDSKSYAAERLAKGVNLAAEFPRNPFSEAFGKVDGAVAAKQEYETRQIKTLFHGPEATLAMKTVASLTERARAPLVARIREAFVPVTHSIQVVAE
jgi:hypothetical protein